MKGVGDLGGRGRYLYTELMEEEEEEEEPILRCRNGYHPLNRHWETSRTIPRVVAYVYSSMGCQEYQKWQQSGKLSAVSVDPYCTPPRPASLSIRSQG